MKKQNDTFYKRLQGGIKFLIEPPQGVTDPQQRRQTTLLSALLLIIILFGSLSGVAQWVFVPGFFPTFVAIAGAEAILCVAYIFSRTKYYLASALVASITPSIASYVALLNNPRDQSAFVFMLVSVVLGSILLNRWWTLGIAGLNLLGLLLLPVLQTVWAYSNMAGPISIHVIFPALILIAMWHRDWVEGDRQRELRESEARYRAIVEGTTDLICRFLPDTTLTYVNETYCHYFGRSRGQLIGTRFLALTPESEWEGIQSQVNRIIESREPFTYSHEVITPSGEIRWQQWTDNVILNESGQVVELQSVGRDITESRRTELSLRLSEEKFARAFQASPDVIVLTSLASGRVIEINDSLPRLSGYTREEVVGKTTAELRFWADSADRERYVTTLQREGRARDLEVAFRIKSGEIRQALLSGEIIELQDGKYILGVIRDITERKKAEADLRSSEERYRHLFASNPQPMWVYEMESLAFLAVNDAAVAKYGYSRDEFLQMTIKDIRPPEDVARLLENVAHVTDGIDRAGYWRHCTRDGRIIDVEITSHTLSFEGRPAEMVLANDVTERKAMEEALRESEALYRQAIEVAGAVPYLQSYRAGNPDIEFDFVGDGIQQITGYGPGEFDLRLWDSLVEESVLLEGLAQYSWEEAIQRVRTGLDSIWKCEHRIRARDGSIHWVFEASVERYDQSGVSQGAIGMFQDITGRKRAEENLRISEQRYRTLAQNLPDSALLLYDHDLRFILADGPELEAAGFSREKLEGNTLYETLPPEFAQRLEAGMRRALAGGKVDEELPFEDRFYGYSHVPLRDGSGKVAMAMILATNITQVKKVENALKDSQRRLSTALQATKVGVWEWDMHTNKTYWSDENYKVMGMEPGSIESRYENWANAVHPEDLPAAEAQVNKAIKDRSELNIEFRVVWPDGTVRWINDIGSLIFDADGEPIGMYGIQMDITERKQIQQELEENRRRLAFLLSGSPSIIYSARASGDFGATFVSGNVTELMGFLPEMFTENSDFWINHVHPEDLSRVQPAIDRLFVTGSHQYEYRFLHADSHYVWTRDEMVLVRDESGNPLEIIGSWIDISGQKRVEEEREKLIAELEAKNSELERFTYTVSHDLKSPLVTIKGFLGFLKQDLALGNAERLQNDIERIDVATLKMEQLLRDLLELSRIGRMVNSSEVVSFEHLVREAMDLVRGQLDQRGVSVLIQPGLPPVFGDHRRLTEVLQNLIDNAAKYMGTQIDPRVEIGQRGEVNGNPLFFVRDNGVGIEPQHHERIFGLFNKLDPGTEGTGIGLALVKRVIEFHGGRIWVESEPGQGSTFLFTLPSVPAADSVI